MAAMEQPGRQGTQLLIWYGWPCEGERVREGERKGGGGRERGEREEGEGERGPRIRLFSSAVPSSA